MFSGDSGSYFDSKEEWYRQLLILHNSTKFRSGPLSLAKLNPMFVIEVYHSVPCRLCSRYQLEARTRLRSAPPRLGTVLFGCPLWSVCAEIKPEGKEECDWSGLNHVTSDRKDVDINSPPSRRFPGLRSSLWSCPHSEAREDWVRSLRHWKLRKTQQHDAVDKDLVNVSFVMSWQHLSV